MKKKKSEFFKFIILFSFSISILIILYQRIDIKEFQIIFENSNIYLLILGVFINILLGLISGLKYSYFARSFGIKPHPNIITSIKSFFIAATFNIVLPSKLADFGKGIICNKLDKTCYPETLHGYTLYEKLSELFSLICITLSSLLFLKFKNSCISFSQNSSCSIFIFQNNIIYILIIIFLVSLLIINPFINFKLITKHINFKRIRVRKNLNFYFKNKLEKFFIYQICNLTFWILNIFQLMIYGLALNMNFFSISGILVIAITILSGLIPISFAGIGTRELTLTILLESFFGETKPLLFGILFTSRYIVPALLGLLFLNQVNYKSNY